MIVLHVHSGNLYGGVETVLVTLAKARAAAMEPHFAVCFEGRLASELRAAGTPVHLLGEVRLSRPDAVRRARRRLRRTAAAVQPAIVLTHLPWTHAAFGRALKAGDAPLAQCVHGPLEGVVGRLAQLTRPDALVCNSRYTRAALPAAYRAIPAETIYWPAAAPVAIDGAIRSATRASLATPDDAVVIVQASRLEPWKGHREHLHALATLADVPEWVLWIVGGAQRRAEALYRAELERLARSLGIGDRVRFVGEQQDVARFLGAADVYCQPNSAPEPFGMIYAEALYSALPVVASRSGALPEIVSEDCGILVEPADVAALATALRSLISDRDRRVRLGSAGAARVRHLCDPSRQLARLTAFLDGVRAGSAA